MTPQEIANTADQLSGTTDEWQDKSHGRILKTLALVLFIAITGIAALGWGLYRSATGTTDIAREMCREHNSTLEAENKRLNEKLTTAEMTIRELLKTNMYLENATSIKEMKR